MTDLTDKNVEEHPFNALTDDQIRDRARELHEQDWVIEVHEDAQVIRPKYEGECARIAAWIYLGPDD
jgi:hypothetical protein